MSKACEIADTIASKVQLAGPAIQRGAEQIADDACDVLGAVTREVCDASETVATEVCDRTDTVSETICQATQAIPFVGGLICVLSQTVSRVVCVASRIVAQVVCVASHVVTETTCVSISLIARTGGTILGGAVSILGEGLAGVAEIVCFLTAGPQPPLRPPLPPGDTTIDPRINGDQVVPVLTADIRAAQHNIHVSMFLLFNDPMGQWFADELIAKASGPRAIPVRVMFDWGRTKLGDPMSSSAKRAVESDPNFQGDPTDVQAIVERLRRGRVQVIRTDIDYEATVATDNSTYRKEATGIRRALLEDPMRHFFEDYFQITDHRKIITIDDRIGYLGSANVGCQYFYRNRIAAGTDADVEVVLALAPPGQGEPWLKWHDSLTRVDGPVTYVLEEYFRRRWVLNGGGAYVLRPPQFPTPARPPNVEVLTATPGFQNDILKMYVQRIKQATQSIFIENSYCYHPTIIEQIVKARKKNPKLSVRMIMPSAEYNDNPLSQDAQENHYERLLDAGVELYEYDHHFTHMKLATFDGRFSVLGSANLNYRSLEWNRDFELVIIVDDPQLALRIDRDVQNFDIQQACNKMTLQSLTISHQTRNPLTVAGEEMKIL